MVVLLGLVPEVNKFALLDNAYRHNNKHSIRISTAHFLPMLGGGTGGKVAHSAVADVYDVSTGESKSWRSALSEGRWGLACATVKGAIHFAGGKVRASL